MSNGGINVARSASRNRYECIVTQLVALQQAPANQMATQQNTIASAQTQISSYTSALPRPQERGRGPRDPPKTSFTSMGVSSSDSSIATSVSGSPAAGQWSVSVSQIAQEQRTLSTGTDDSTAALGLSGNLEYHFGSGSTASIAWSIRPTPSRTSPARSAAPASASRRRWSTTDRSTTCSSRASTRARRTRSTSTSRASPAPASTSACRTRTTACRPRRTPSSWSGRSPSPARPTRS